mgnify:CR=1 FL=1
MTDAGAGGRGATVAGAGGAWPSRALAAGRDRGGCWRGATVAGAGGGGAALADSVGGLTFTDSVGGVTITGAGPGVTRKRGVPWALPGIEGGGVLVAGDAGLGGVARGVTEISSGVTRGVLLMASSFRGIGSLRGGGGVTGGLTTTSADRPTGAGADALGARVGGVRRTGPA